MPQSEHKAAEIVAKLRQFDELSSRRRPVGRTHGCAHRRARELQGTGVPTWSEVVATFTVPDPVGHERAAHRALAAHRVTPSREFFQLGAKEAIARMFDAFEVPNADLPRPKRGLLGRTVRWFCEVLLWIVGGLVALGPIAAAPS